jgi:hypothetical protein
MFLEEMEQVVPWAKLCALVQQVRAWLILSSRVQFAVLDAPEPVQVGSSGNFRRSILKKPSCPF